MPEVVLSSSDNEGDGTLTLPTGASVTFRTAAGEDRQWFKGTTALPGETGASLTLPSLTADNSGIYTIKVGSESQGSINLQVTVNNTVVIPPIWDPIFAGITGAILLIIVLVLSLVPFRFIWTKAFAQANLTQANLVLYIVPFFIFIGFLSVASALYLTLLELRGRHLTRREIQSLTIMRQADGQVFAVTGAGTAFPIADLIKIVPDALKAFGGLSASAALMVFAIFLFGFAAAIGWRSLPAPKAGVQSQTTVESSADTGGGNATPTPTPAGESQ